MKMAQEILGYIDGWIYGIFPDKTQDNVLAALRMLRAYITETNEHIEHPLCNKESRRREIEYADLYSHRIWEELMEQYKYSNSSIGCNDVSDIVLNAILDTLNGRSFDQWYDMKKANENRKKMFDDIDSLSHGGFDPQTNSQGQPEGKNDVGEIIDT